MLVSLRLYVDVFWLDMGLLWFPSMLLFVLCCLLYWRHLSTWPSGKPWKRTPQQKLTYSLPQKSWLFGAPCWLATVRPMYLLVFVAGSLRYPGRSSGFLWVSFWSPLGFLVICPTPIQAFSCGWNQTQNLNFETCPSMSILVGLSKVAVSMATTSKLPLLNEKPSDV